MTAMRIDAALAATVGAVALGLYVATLPPSYAFWDTGELQTVASILGIAHPPACPAFVLLGWLFAHALPIANEAWRIDFMSACAVALSAALLFACAREFRLHRGVALACAFGFALCAVAWKDATRAEVQDVALLFRAGALFFAFRYARTGSGRDFLVAAFATGLAGATHGISVLLVPGLALVVFSRGRPPVRLLAGGLAAVACGLLPYAYLPLRSAYIFGHHLDPTLAIGLPVGLPFWDYDHPSTWRNFGRVLTGADFDVHSGFAGFLELGEYGHFGEAFVRRVYGAYGYLGCLIAAVGAGSFFVRRDVRGMALVLVALLPVPYTESYNELQDPDRYYLFTLWCVAIAMGVGFDLVLDLMRVDVRSVVRYVSLAALVASFAAADPDRRSMFDQAHDFAAPQYVADVKSLTPNAAILLAEWAYSTPLAYAAYVDGALGDRTVVASSPTQYLAYVPRWLRTRPVYVVSFDDALALPGFSVKQIRDGPYYVYEIGLQKRARPRPHAPAVRSRARPS